MDKTNGRKQVVLIWQGQESKLNIMDSAIMGPTRSHIQIEKSIMFLEK